MPPTGRGRAADASTRGSQVWPCEHAAAAVANNPRGRAVIIEDAGHTVSFDQPDAFAAVLLDFLEGLGRE